MEGAPREELGLVLSPSGAVVCFRGLVSVGDTASGAVGFLVRPCSQLIQRDGEGATHTC